MGGYYQNHVDNNIVLLGCSCHCLFLEHGLSCILIWVVIHFILNGITDEATINDGTIFIHFSVTSFVTRLSSCTNKLGQNSIHYYLLFVLKFVVRVVWIPMAMLLGMSKFIALTTNHIYSPSFIILFLLGWWLQQLSVFIGVSHIFFANDYNFFMFKQGVPLHPRCCYLEIWL